MSNQNNELHAALRPLYQGLFPSLDSLESVLELGQSQLPIRTPNELVSILMIHQNTLLKLISTELNKETIA